MKVWAHIADTLERGVSCALVTVAKIEGSTPREVGARMVVLEDQSFAGTIGGGTLEFEVIRRAASAAGSGPAKFTEQIVSLGPDLGQCCGGRVTLAIETFTANELAITRELRALEKGGHAFGTSAEIKNGQVGSRQILSEPPQRSISIEDGKIEGAQLLREVFGAAHRPLYVFGAGHIGKALMLALAPLPFKVIWVDSRADQFPGPVPANVMKVCNADVGEVLESAPAGAFVLAVTHSHALDEEIMARALLQQKFAYCGVIGSKTKRARFLKRLKSRGLTEALLTNMVCPVGNTAIRSKHPAAIAAGIAVDLLQRDEADHQQVTASGGLAQIIPHGQ